MKNILLFLFCLCLFTFSLKAALQTATHTYILIPQTDSILKIDRITGITENIYVGRNPQSMGLYSNDDVTYLLIAHVISQDLWVIDLKTHKCVIKIDCDGELRDLFIYKDWVYFINYTKCQLVRFKANKYSESSKSLDLQYHPSAVGVAQNFAYIASLEGNNVLKINLDTLSLEKSWSKTDAGLCKPLSLRIYKDTPYVIDCLEGYIFILSDPLPRKLKVNYSPADLLIEKNCAYIISKDYKGTCLSKWNLETEHEVKSVIIKNTSMIRDFQIHKGTAYLTDVSYVYKVNLQNFSVTKTEKNPRFSMLNFSETHLYLGNIQFEPLQHPVILFDDPYEGIKSFHFGEDAEAAFTAFREALENQEVEVARAHFDVALALVHPKAYATAAHAFFNGIWGAPEQMSWVLQFIPGMDLEYFNELERNLSVKK